jgi:twitching motility protein PilT
MRLTLNAAETGHLVLATAHSATANEALQRVVAAFPAESQSGVCAQLADSVVAVVCQRLIFRDDLKMQVPECEVLMPSHAVKNFIRRGEFFKIMTVMETGADQGMWTYQRYRSWLETRKTWHRATEGGEDEPAGGGFEAEEMRAAPLPRPAASSPAPARSPASAPAGSRVPAGGTAGTAGPGAGRLEIQPEEGGLDAIITKLKTKP